ncbi:AAA family ATPase [Pseudomonas songnenensis]|uniref:AAA family ATPase n=1 Tax=Pseudomonas songnenensis TaxID=1176259 RepID=A0A482U7P7_9PSED|nr:AAA family ATPase [Pseudomonas songnenensis]MCQ4298516.1 AAA family ATPase [Pseudomonas songnenensis]RMH96651.1 AAA family ATPase [Pseudomonas songnenensis]RYJ62726.1 AAA family ATPase [Pseudomonas songnenensis]
MKKPRLLQGRRGLALSVLSLLLLAAVALWLVQPSAPADSPAAGSAAAMLGELQSSRESWEANRGDLSRLMGDLRGGAIASAALGADAVYVTTTGEQRYWVPDQSGRVAALLLDQYAASGAELFPLAMFQTDAEKPFYKFLLPYSPIALLLIGAAIFFAMKTRGFDVQRKGSGVTFADVIGAAEAKQALSDVTAYLRDPAAYARLGARPPKGVLLTGEPGTGKTQLAKALASESNASFIQVTGSDFSSMYFGVGIQKVKSLFRTARKQAPCIIFIDEIDGIGKRAEQTRSSDAESNRIINQFLAEMDGFDGAAGVLVLGATNFPNSLDPALVREGRFDRSIAVGLPGLDDREALFRLYAGKITAAAELDFPQLARNTVGLTPAAIAYIVNHAALLAARAGARQVDMAHFVDAVETCRIGEQPSGVTPMSPTDRKRIAVHEAGHALVAAALNVGRVEKVTILPRGQALGVTLVTPVEDKRLHMYSELRNRIQMLLAGRGAEQLYFHEVSSGAGQDLQEASKIALSMVGALGMGPRGSLLSLQAVRDAHLESDPREALEAADELLQQLNQDCLALLQRLKPALDHITERLLECETVAGEEVLAAVAQVPADRAHAVSPLHGPATGLERVAASGFDDSTGALFDLVAGEPKDTAEPEGPGMA